MSQVYMSTSQQGVTGEVARELLHEGLSPGHIRIYSARPAPAKDLPVPITRYRSPGRSMSYGAVAGALVGALVGLPLLMLGGFGVAPLLVLVLAGALGGGVFRQWLGDYANPDIYRLDGALRRGETVMVLDVDKARVAELEHKVKARHPEVAVLGTDPEGTPPFP